MTTIRDEPWYKPGRQYYADSGDLNAISGAEIRSMGFTGVFPYAGIGGGGSLPNKRLTADRYHDYIGSGIAVPGAFVESGIYDADGGYSAGRANASAALADLSVMHADIQFIIAVNDKTTFGQADIEYVRGFRDVVGYGRTGVYGFSNYLTMVHASGYARYYHQCGISPQLAGTYNFVNVWQHNNDSYNGLDVNELLIDWRSKGHKMSINFFVRNGSGDPVNGFSDIVMEIGNTVYKTEWAQYLAKEHEGIASLTGFDDDDYANLIAVTDAQKSIPGVLEMILAKVNMPVDTGAVQKAIGGALKNAGNSLDPS